MWQKFATAPPGPLYNRQVQDHLILVLSLKDYLILELKKKYLVILGGISGCNDISISSNAWILDIENETWTLVYQQIRCINVVDFHFFV